MNTSTIAKFRPILCLGYASAYSFAILILSLVVSGSASFMGQDMSRLAAGVVSFYPWVAVLEVVWLLVFTVGAFWVLFLYSFWVFDRLTSRVSRGFLRIGLPCLFHLCMFLGAVFRYPAFYEASLPSAVADLVFAAPEWLRPGAFVAAGVGILVLAGAWALWGRARTNSGMTAVIGFLAVGLVAPVIAGFERHDFYHERSRPNILLLAVDSLRSDRVRDPEIMPEVTNLITDPDVVEFQRHYVGIPRTFPSWVEILSGQWAARSGIRHMFPGLAVRKKSLVTMGTVLRQRGYRSVVVSDFAGDIFPRFEAGFDSVQAPGLSIGTMIRLAVHQAMPLVSPMLLQTSGRSLFKSLAESPVLADSNEISNTLFKELDKIRGPWFAVVFFSTAHFPYAAPHPWYKKFADRNYEGDFRFQKNPDLSQSENISPEDIAQTNALYDGALASVDDQIGNIVRKLKETGAWQNTVVAITADHGEDLYDFGKLQGHGEHLRGENVLRVPFILKKTWSYPLGRQKFEGISRSVDVAPTLLGVAGVEFNAPDGVNLTPSLKDAHVPVPDLAAYSETGIWFASGGGGFYQSNRLEYPGISELLHFDPGRTGDIILNPTYENIVLTSKHRAYIRGDYKLIYAPASQGVKWELYNVIDDPDNRKDLVDIDPIRTEEMRAALQTHITKVETLRPRNLGGFWIYP